ncbi:cation diffusion facilitator family transporter [Chloroflexota bacterium]
MFSTRSGAAKLALAVVIGLIVLKVVVAVITGSISITAQAVDSFLDLFAISITLFAVRVAGVPADEEHPFGHGKVEGIAAIVQAVLILTAGGWIIYSAVRRIIVGTTLEMTEAGIGVMLVSIIASVFLSRHLLKVSRATDSIALEASARNIAADVYSAAGVLVVLVAIRFTRLSILDPIIALGVALFILKAAYDVMRKSFSELVDVRLPKVEEDELISCITEHSGQLVGFHAVRTRKAGSQRFIDLHLMLPKNASVEEAHQMCDHLEQDIENRLPNSNVTIHVEPCSTECDQCLVSSCSLRIDISLDSKRLRPNG